MSRDVGITLNTRLINVKHTVEELSIRSVEIRDTLEEIVLGVDMLPAGGYGEEAREAADRAMAAELKANVSEASVSKIVARLPEDQTRLYQIPRDIDEANKSVRDAQGQVEQVEVLVPTALGLLDRLSVQAERIKQLGAYLRGNMTALRSMVLVARDQANLIKVIYRTRLT